MLKLMAPILNIVQLREVVVCVYVGGGGGGGGREGNNETYRKVISIDVVTTKLWDWFQDNTRVVVCYNREMDAT